MAYGWELMAIIHALKKKLHHYLYGAMFEVWTNHESLKWLSSQKELIGRKVNWVQILQEFDLQLHYQKGKFNIVVDMLSHMPMVNKLSFTKFKSRLLESLKGLCEHDASVAKLYMHIIKKFNHHLPCKKWVLVQRD